MPEILL